MKRILIACLLLLPEFVLSQAALPEKVSPAPEKCYFHLDKQAYLPGETIWFKVYLLNNGIPSDISTSLYTELFDEAGNLLQKKIYPVADGSTNGNFELPDTVLAGKLLLRACTRSMLNFDPPVYYSRLIPVISLKENNRENKAVENKITLAFFPEGGNFVEALENIIAFKAADSYQAPVYITGTVKDETGAVAADLNVLHDGMGKFKFIPEAGHVYTAYWTDAGGQSHQSPLPRIQKEQLTLHLDQLNDNVFYTVQNPTDKPAFNEVHITASIYQQRVYQANLDMSNNVLIRRDKIPIKGLPAGGLLVTIYDANWKPCAERVIFINKQQARLEPVLQVKESNLAKRAKNILEIEVPDTIKTNLSVSVTDAYNGNGTGNEPGMAAALLLNSDTRGPVFKPDYYFDSNADSVKQQLDLVMLTNGWRRYRAVDDAAKIPVEENYISFSGTVADAGKATGDSLTVILKESGNQRSIYMVKPDQAGHFALNGLLFYDSATVYYSMNKNKQLNTGISIDTSNGLLKTWLTIPAIKDLAQYETSVAGPGTFYTTTYTEQRLHVTPAFEQKGKILEQVTVKSKSGGWHNWKNDPALKLDEKYATGYFKAGSSARSFDVMNDPSAAGTNNIFVYLSSRLPVMLKQDQKGYFLVDLRVDPRSKAREGLDYYIDESIAFEDQVDMLQVSQVAYIKFYPAFTFIMSQNRGLLPVVAIYTKKGEDYNPAGDAGRLRLKTVKISGYQPVKEFYSPDYSNPAEKAAAEDLRTTLYWQPYIFTDAVSRKAIIEFYNNDFSKKLHIVLEGMNQEGKLVHLVRDLE